MCEKRKSILVVDDQNVNRSLMRRILEREYEVVEARDGEEAIEKIKEQKQITAILLDLIMPKKDGYAVLAYLQEQRLFSIPVIVLTGEQGEKAEKAELRALNCGAWDFVTKPIHSQVLMTRLNNAIARSEVTVYDQMRRMMERDPLTGLYNRNKLFAEAKKLLKEWEGKSFCLVRVDIKRFHLFNAAFGEKEGDQLLIYMANQIRRKSRQLKPCVYGRMDADVFCICTCCENGLGEEMIEETAEMLKNYREDYLLEPAFGIYRIEEPDLSMEEMYIRASMGSRKCKAQFGSYVGFYDQKEQEDTQKEQTIINQMKKALDEGQFEVYYQPKFHMATEQPHGAEALVRWNHPEQGKILPGNFIPIFEKNGFVAKLDYYMWEQVCFHLHKWLVEGYDPKPVSVNVSRISLYNPRLVEQFEELTAKYQVPAYLLNLEITESAYMSDPELMHTTIQKLHRAGFVIMMDDFGKDYSSLNALKDIEADILKIDMNFLSDTIENEREKIILASVIRMANWLGMSVVVEGVEQEAQKNFLESVGCDYIQGYYYARAMSWRDYERDYIYRTRKQTKRKERLGQVLEQEQEGMVLVLTEDVNVLEVFEACIGKHLCMQPCDQVEEAMDYLKKYTHSIRLLVIDNTMQGFSGLEFMEFYQDDVLVGSIPKVVVSRREEIDTQIRALRLGAYECIEKPLNREVTEARLSRVLQLDEQIRSFQQRGNQYKSLAESDKMTGLLNKTAYQKRCESTLKQDPKSIHALMVLDIDDFKQINDSYGHLTGDETIKCVSQEIHRTFRKGDLLGRFGGDEFVILMNGITRLQNARLKADELSKSICAAGAQKLNRDISVSIGIAFNQEGDTFESLFARADQALYDAKKMGKGKVVIYGESVPSIYESAKSIVMVCSKDERMYQEVALAYGTAVAFCNAGNIQEVQKQMQAYQGRIQTVCLDMRESCRLDGEEFWKYLESQGVGEYIPMLAACDEGNMKQLREALKRNIQDVFMLPPQIDRIQRKISRCLLRYHRKRKEIQIIS